MFIIFLALRVCKLKNRMRKLFLKCANLRIDVQAKNW
nr:MAG TPA: hypothetical protein [Caudoviricetes sp.]